MSQSSRRKLNIDDDDLDQRDLDFMYYPDIESPNFYQHLWSKQEFMENKSPPQEYFEDPEKKKKLLKDICTPDVLKLKNHQVFLRNYLSPETPYNGLLVFHGVGTGKCVLPDTEVYVNGCLVRIEDLWSKFKSNKVKIDDDQGEWSLPRQELKINAYDQVEGKLLEHPVKRLYRQKIKENIKVLTLVSGHQIKLTQMHHLLTENGWSTDFLKNKYVSVPSILKNNGNFFESDKIFKPKNNNQSKKVESKRIEDKFEDERIEDKLEDEIKLVRIKSVEDETYEGYVYDLEVDKYHNYVANGIICHNTCAAVVIAEGLKSMTEKYNKKIYVIAGGLLQGNFRDTLYDMGREKNSKYPGSLQCTKTTYYIPPKKKESTEERKIREKAIRELQKKHYVYLGYIAFVHFVETIQKDHDLGEYFSNSVFVIDEAHNLIARSGSKSKAEEESRKTREKLQEIFRVAENTKLVLLTATPITNEIDDIIVLINLLRANDKKSIYTSNDLINQKGSSGQKLTKENLNVEKFKEFIKGYVSYVRGSHPSSFPTEIPINQYNRQIQADMFGDRLTDKLPSFKELSLVECEMSDFHFYNYYIHNIMIERNSLSKGRDSHGDQLKIQAATAMYPDVDSDDPRQGSYRLDELLTKEKKGRVERYRYKSDELFLDVTDENHLHSTKGYPSADNKVGYPLARYSTKFYHLLHDIINNRGINFIFTRYKTAVGTIPISLMLEQNGYVRYHRNLGKPNEYSGKYSEGLSNHLDLARQGRKIKYRCICGYLYEEHERNYSGKTDWSDPRKHRFLQGTYVRVDGETSDEFDQYNRTVLNSPDNRYGERIKIIVGGMNMREGVNLKYVRSVHIMNPWHNLIQIEQTIGRAIRLCSHADLDQVDQMNVKVYKYVAVPPRTKMPVKYSLSKAIETLEDSGELDLSGVKFKDRRFWLENLKSNNPSNWMSVDEYIYVRALNKDYNIKFAERLMKESAVDCYLNLKTNINFPGDKDGSRVCDYTKCEYQCDYNFKPPRKPNLDTYDLYFMEPKVQDAQEVIGDLFTRNWGLMLDSIVELAQKKDPKLTRDIIYLALDRIIGDPPKIKPMPILDQYGRYGYLIHRYPFYIYQPNEVSDENLSVYFRQVPSKGKKGEIDVKPVIQPKKKEISLTRPLRLTGSPADRLSNQTIKSQVTSLGSQIESVLAPIQNQNDIASVLDFFTSKQHEYLIRTRIEEWCSKFDKDGGTFIRKIISYYMENYLLANPKMVYDKHDKVKNIPQTAKDWVYNVEGKYWTYKCATKEWVQISEGSPVMDEIKIRQESSDGPTFSPIRRELSDDMYGFLYDDNKRKEVKFKITDVGGQDVKTKRYSEDTNIKTLHRGQVCQNYSNEQLEKLCDRLGVKYDTNQQRTSLCSLLETELRKKDRKDHKQIWFLNFFNYKRKFGRLEESDLTSFYHFYLGGESL